MTDDTPETDHDNARHHEKMAKKKAARDKIMAGKTIEKGLLIVHTGKGKGKSTAAFGMVFRCVGHGMKSGVIQFVKGAWGTGERTVLEQFPDLVTIKAMGEGFTWENTGPRARHRPLPAPPGRGEKDDRRPSYRMVLLDELNIVLRYDYLPLAEVLEVLRNKPADKHVIVTGRNAKEELIEIADLVTELEQVKHPFRSGVKAQAGIEF